jgi:hypothetical protein
VAGGDVRDQRVRHARLLQLPRGEPRALEVRPRLVDPDVDRPAGVVGGLDDAQCRPELAAGQRPGVAVGQEPQVAGLAPRQLGEAEVGDPTVVVGGLPDDRVRLGAELPCDEVTVGVRAADRLEPGEQPVDRPAGVHRGGAGVAEGVRGAADIGATGIWPLLARPMGGQRQPQRSHLADRRGTPDDHVADRARGIDRGVDLELDELLGQAALVDDEQGVVTVAEPEWASEAGGGSAGPRRLQRLRRRGHRAGIQDGGGRLRGRLADGLRGAHDRRRVLDDLARELPEEPAAGEVGVGWGVGQR